MMTNGALFLRSKLVGLVTAALLCALSVGVATAIPKGPAGAVTFCPNPLTTKVLTLSYMFPTPAVTVHPGDSFTVIVPPWTWGPIFKVTIDHTSIVRRECSQLLANGTRREILFAASAGTTLLTSTVPARGNLMIPAWRGRVNVVMPPIVLSPLPRTLTAGVTRQGSYGNPAASGSLVTRSELNSSLTSVDIIGSDGYALAFIGGFEYPVVTLDGGRTWRVAGLWFAGDWADAAWFTSQMTTFSPKVAVSWDPSGALYTTSDAGKQWFAALFPSMIMRVTAAPATASVPPAALVVTIVRMGPHGPKMARFHSIDGGRHWTLI